MLNAFTLQMLSPYFFFFIPFELYLLSLTAVVSFLVSTLVKARPNMALVKQIRLYCLHHLASLLTLKLLLLMHAAK